MKPATWASAVVGDACAGCRRPGLVLCRGCGDLLRHPEGAPSPPAVTRVHAGWRYEAAARALVIALKERGRRGCAAPLAGAAAAAVWRAGLSADVLTWVPGNPAAARARGFDHGEVLATQVGERLGLRARPLIERVRIVRDQVGLSGRERRANLAGAFEARPNVPPRVALVDDVLTTGATAAACARALRSGGATSVEVVVACLTG
jgi:predicted amidophosphoribosyltransferase